MPGSSTLKSKELAKRLLANEAATPGAVEVKERAALRVCEKMRGPLSRLMGMGGFHSLLSRALTLATLEVPALGALRVNPQGALEGHEETRLESRAISQGETALVAELLGLLVTFIGASLTLSLLRDIWPKLDDLEL